MRRNDDMVRRHDDMKRDTAKIRAAHKRKAIAGTLDLLRAGGAPRAMKRPTELARRLRDPEAFDAYCAWIDEYRRSVLNDPILNKLLEANEAGLRELRDIGMTDEQITELAREYREKLGYVQKVIETLSHWGSSRFSSLREGSINHHALDGLLFKAADEVINGYCVVIVGSNARGERLYRIQKA